MKNFLISLRYCDLDDDITFIIQLLLLRIVVEVVVEN